MILPGSTEFSILHRSVRLTDAASNFGWSPAVSEVIAQISNAARVDRSEIFTDVVSYPVLPRVSVLHPGCTDYNSQAPLLGHCLTSLIQTDCGRAGEGTTLAYKV